MVSQYYTTSKFHICLLPSIMAIYCWHTNSRKTNCELETGEENQSIVIFEFARSANLIFIEQKHSRDKLKHFSAKKG